MSVVMNYLLQMSLGFISIVAVIFIFTYPIFYYKEFFFNNRKIFLLSAILVLIWLISIYLGAEPSYRPPKDSEKLFLEVAFIWIFCTLACGFCILVILQIISYFLPNYKEIIKEHKTKFIIGILSLTLFYWFEIRPSQIRKKCSKHWDYAQCLKENGLAK